MRRDLVDRIILGPCDDRFGQKSPGVLLQAAGECLRFLRRAPGLRVTQPAMNSFVTFNSGQGDPGIPLRTIVLFISDLCQYGSNDVLYTIAHGICPRFTWDTGPLYCRTHKVIIEAKVTQTPLS
ncbi:MAG: hypothetical protein MZV70_59800 [Desulfobacterales bacterium]|nr:hypothetical protein [Desulfobacterales bacterium]